MENVASTFFRGVKPRAVEELIDFYFHRRLAVPVVWVSAKIGLSPNQVTCLSLITGCFSALLFWKNQFVAGALLLLIAVVLDCADGMLARITGRANPAGKIIDGIFDLIWVAAIWVGIFMSGRFTIDSGRLLHLMEAAAISTILHCWTYDAVKTSYLNLCEAGLSEKDLNRDEAKGQMRISFQKRRYLEGVIYFIMWLHHILFVNEKDRTAAPSLDQQLRARERLLYPMRLWSFLGEGTHLGLMFVAGLLTPLWPSAMISVFVFILIPMNLLWVYAGLVWMRRKKGL